MNSYIPAAMPVAELSAAWRTKADELRRYAPAAAAAFEDCAADLEAARRCESDELLTLREASEASGYSERRLQEKIAAGEIVNAGRKHVPRIRRGDCPARKPSHKAVRGPEDQLSRALRRLGVVE